jgi:hypothetical protein
MERFGLISKVEENLAVWRTLCVLSKDIDFLSVFTHTGTVINHSPFYF